MHKKTICTSCLAYIHDMMFIEPILTDPFYSEIHWPRLKPLIPKLSRILYSLLSRINKLDSYMIEKSTEMYLIRNYDLNEYATKEELKWYYMCKYIETHRAKEEISILLELLEDNSITGPVIAKRWIGYWIERLWTLFSHIHVEHTTKSPTYAGPPIGMKIQPVSPECKCNLPPLPPSVRISSAKRELYL
jgi:hypothetical protein